MRAQQKPGQSQVSIEPMNAALGAFIHGLDFESIDAESSATLQNALHHHGVLIYRSPTGEISADQMMKLALVFGTPNERQYGKVNPSEDSRINYIDSSVTSAKDFNIDRWHTDGMPEACPPRAALLNPVVLPDRGGDTLWACMHKAYEALSPKLQSFLDGLEAEHSTERALSNMTNVNPDIFKGGSKSIHPVVCTDPVTKRRMLYINGTNTERIIGLNRKESDVLVKMLADHVNTAEFHLRWHWQLGEVAIWNERTTQHRAVSDYEGRRVVRRIVLQGTKPT